MVIADRKKVVLVIGYSAGIGCWGGGTLILFGGQRGWGLCGSGDPGGACAGRLGTAGICRERGAVVMGYSAKDQFGQKTSACWGAVFTFYTIGWANTV